MLILCLILFTTTYYSLWLTGGGISHINSLVSTYWLVCLINHATILALCQLGFFTTHDS